MEYHSLLSNQGISGYSGISGFSGDSPGSSGYSGLSGISGYSGISGAIGPIGNSGISGLDGTASQSGYSGASGYSGIGASGYSGIGASGYSGLSGQSGYSGSTAYWVAEFYIPGILAVGTSLAPSFIIPVDCTIVKAYGVARTGPTTQSILIDINKNGTSIWGTSGYSGVSGYSGKLAIPPSGSNSSGTQPLFVTTDLVEGDRLDIDIDQVGIGTSGADLTVGLKLRVPGASGLSGYSGLSGVLGLSGASGFSGIGTSGYSGKSGYSGISGATATSGYSGSIGTSGFSGKSGYSGIIGTSGYSGISGSNSFSGTIGTSQIENLAVTRDAQFYGSSGVTLPYTDTAEHEIGTITVVTNTVGDSVLIWATLVVTEAAYATAKGGGAYIPIDFRIRRDSISGTIIAGAITLGQTFVPLDAPPVSIIGRDVPGGSVGNHTYKLTAQLTAASDPATGQGIINYRRIIALVRSR
jgi:hypothetical protein